MKKLIVLSHNDNYTVSGLIRYLIKMFYEDSIVEIFKEVGIEIITSKYIREKLNITDIDFLKSIKNTDEYIILGIHPYGMDTALNSGTSIKKVIWQDDLHYFAHYEERDGLSVQRYSKKYTPRFLDRIDFLITPSSIYFKNLDITEFDEKVVDFFYFLNEDFYTLTGNIEYEKRIDSVILSGAVGHGYTSRMEFNSLRKYPEFSELIYKLEHPGYSDNEHMTELNYYNELTKYKAAFVGHYNFPINFLLAKHIEVLMCGCLGFFEPNNLLESQLGLVPFKHYIPVYDNDGLIKDPSFYRKWMNSEEGKKIASEGKDYVRKKFGKEYIKEFANFLSSI